MAIETYYTIKASTRRLTPVAGTDKEIFQDNIEALACRIEQQGEEPVMLADGAFYNLFKMWCNKVDIKEGDEVISNGITYIVKGVSGFKRATELVHHLEILLAQPR